MRISKSTFNWNNGVVRRVTESTDLIPCFWEGWRSPKVSGKLKEELEKSYRFTNGSDLAEDYPEIVKLKKITSVGKFFELNVQAQTAFFTPGHALSATTSKVSKLKRISAYVSTNNLAYLNYHKALHAVNGAKVFAEAACARYKIFLDEFSSISELPQSYRVDRFKGVFEEQFIKLKKKRNEKYLESLKKMLLAKVEVDINSVRTNIVKQPYMTANERAWHGTLIDQKYFGADQVFL